MNSIAKIFVGAGLVCAIAGSACAAQRDTAAYPTRPIRLMVPQNPGASVDNISRILAARMGTELGQQIVADNRAGAGGTLAAEVVAHAAPDGQTLFAVATGTAVISPQTFKQLSYDPIKDFEYISLFAITQNVLVVHPSLPVKSVKEFLAYAKANPGKLNMANAGSASQSHLACVLFTHMAGIDVVHVPYKSGPPALSDLVAGQVSFMLENMPGTMPFVRDGKLRALAITSLQRSPLAPDLPTVAEAGVPGYEMIGWNGIFLPKGVPPEVVERLHGALATILRGAELRAQFARLGAEAVGNAPATFAAFVREESTRWGKIIRDRGIKPE